ncbi:MAG: GNAT family N-acetyltransferase [Rhizobiaceae bacterium]|nr:GNAT family N-acetyltransferase [Rhizobiaceae bacterium]
MLHESWIETYTDELGANVAKTMADVLSSDDLAGLVPDRDEQAVIALHGLEICGSAVSASRHGITYLWGCYILQRYQRKGIGRALILKATSVHSVENTIQIFVLKSSNNAVQFYESLGFKTVSEDSLEVIEGHSVPSLVMTIKASALT